MSTVLHNYEVLEEEEEVLAYWGRRASLWGCNVIIYRRKHSQSLI